MTYYYCDCDESKGYYYEKDGYCPYCLKKLHPIIGNEEKELKRPFSKEERDEVIKERYHLY